MLVEFLGVGTCMPDNAEEDTASFVVNKHIIVDTGWHVIRNLLRANIKPEAIDTIFFTHMHQDHYLSLTQYLFYLMNGFHTFGDLKIYGPENLEEYVDMALTYAGYEKYYLNCGHPAVIPLKDHDRIELSDVTVSCIPSHHAITGRCYRFTNADGHGSFTCSGDTAKFDELAEFAAGSNVLIHEASFGPNPAPADNSYCHSSAFDAANIAKLANVQTLYMVHSPIRNRAASVEVARRIFPDSRWPVEGEQFTV